ncbi:MAG: Protein GrpE [Candidatus Magasanikbacteria bacterium GW2011_GWC2_40_17]|uniref:Protein GrpE n=1 Tax=Candidatus Magasanikbacteria bacterium GW2011_GWA2_42_32 TaxID=1619039 RepID=A0A0G1A8T1_9BACT|nr:MAG: Protein GrpE [Candidatus Magasanikbacteria bacterium GW2011_GWC2_40_17]KKS57440.1 MAG: Protein GrpE [Candidatus Magasanikbacteria bacterium GW2011_GWA2_42_32]OGH85568.1 MAG: nucleotide exchange factor GrpE [Candidatus Magasanikbacteria bacterium RIFOXYB2_FULL_38_10]
MSDEPQKKQDDGMEEEKKEIQSASGKTIEEMAGEHFNNWKRALADYDNLKKEVAREKTEMGQFAKGLAAMSFLEVYDNFKKALQHQPKLEEKEADVKNWVLGLSFIKKQFAETLKELGIEEIKTVGEKFDPKLHEAIGEEEGEKTGVIVKEIEGGYTAGGKILKAAKVIVSK